MKFLIWAVIVFLVLAWIMRSKQAANHADIRQARPRAQDRNAGPEAMLPCSHCGVHIPASEAVKHISGAVFCSDEHRRHLFPGA
jgi:uncharacterized protein